MSSSTVRLSSRPKSDRGSPAQPDPASPGTDIDVDSRFRGNDVKAYMTSLGGPLFRQTILFLVLVELFSLCGYLFPVFNEIAFFVIAGVALILTLYKLEYGVYLVLTELFTGSKGFLFFLDLDGTIFSLRMALWLMVLGVWFTRLVVRGVDVRDRTLFLRDTLLRVLYILVCFVAFGVVNGWLRGNAMQDILLDMNAWLFFLLVFPFVSVLRTREHFANVLTILVASTLVTSVKALFFLFVFSHDPLRTIYGPLYRWLRTTGVGEATVVSTSFVRIFLQSQLYTFIALFALLVERARTDHRRRWWCVSAVLTAGILLSFSRSFWVGAIIGAVIAIILVGWRIIPRMLLLGGGAALLIVTAMYFPYPKSLGGDFFLALGERVTETEEAGVGSRWNLLPPLFDELRDAPILGKGFGSTVTYASNDPRIVRSSARGNNLYTTYAFEWGYLDMWLKIGFGGLLAYAVLLWMILRRAGASFSVHGLRGMNDVQRIVLIGIVFVVVTNIFSPYLNHPLGIGFVLLSIAAALVETPENVV